VTVGEWLSSRTPAPPAPLAARLREVLGARVDDRASSAHETVLSTAESLLADLLSVECTTRDRALDLLTVDALVTYAFEAAAESPAALSARAASAMSAIAALATTAHRA
jgi:hypothetical protein